MSDQRDASRIILPPTPSELLDVEVAAWSQPVSIDTYLPEEPDVFPAYLNSRVYQGSSGRVFPLPFHERIAQAKHPREWQAVHIENRWMRLMILPELGGRIHIAYDKIADYDLFYRNNVIKPALVGLTGPWIAGGVEFNWPQHHRPSTFLPTDVEIEREPDGSVTVWCSESEPFARMKGMHGVRLRPDSAHIELRVRLTNRSELRQSFLWWANVAVSVHDDYQSFFPTDVRYVADHARRAITAYPEADRPYYDIDYPARSSAKCPDAGRLDWWRNIPVPTSYMVVDTVHEFFGGYDHSTRAGFVHWASRDISPGKKKWTWGDAPFGEAWEHSLTDGDGPYIELMAGVYTDNQPDFAWLLPGETKSFSQFWYPIREIGPATHASRQLAVRLAPQESGGLQLAMLAAERLDTVTVRIMDAHGNELETAQIDLTPDEPAYLPIGTIEAWFVIEHRGRVILGGDSSEERVVGEPKTALEPPLPQDVHSVDELWTIGTYLQQYRHATRSPEPYFDEALRRDPGHRQSATARGALAYQRAQFDEAERLLRVAIARQTAWAPSPQDGEPRYLLGLTLARIGRTEEAISVLARSAWDGGTYPAAELARARLIARSDRERAIEILESLLEQSPQAMQARNLLSALLRNSTNEGQHARARALTAETLAIDPLDHWARDIAGLSPMADAPTLLDVAVEYSSAGLHVEALRVLDAACAVTSNTALGQVQVAPLVEYHRAASLRRLGRMQESSAALQRGRLADFRWCQALRLDDIAVLQEALVVAGPDPLASLLLGNWYYDRGRAVDAQNAWHVVADSGQRELASIAERNLGIAAYNVDRDFAEARRRYDRARALAPTSAKLLFEADQLSERSDVSDEARLRKLEDELELVGSRDDLTLTRAQLLTRLGRAPEALDLLAQRQFQPWEGGEGQVLRAWETASIAVARVALTAGDLVLASHAIERALVPPPSLGEARHVLANDAELHFMLGEVHHAHGHRDEAIQAWEHAANSTGDFNRMAASEFSLQTAWAVRALRRLGRTQESDALLSDFISWHERQREVIATIDYFATSLPNMLLFVDDPQISHNRELALIREALDDLSATG